MKPITILSAAALMMLAPRLSAQNTKVDMRTEVYRNLTSAPAVFPTSEKEDTGHVMSAAYWKIWNKQVSKKIDADIDKYRKTDVEIALGGDVKPGTKVQVRQTASDVWFGSHIFNFNQLGNHERNEKYKSLFGNLFSSATVAFYWRNWEPEYGMPRIDGRRWDSEEWWNEQPEPYLYIHWRRPASDPVVEFLRQRGLRTQGHCLVWGNRKWSTPIWLPYVLLSDKERSTLRRLALNNPYSLDFKEDNARFKKEYWDMTEKQLEDSFPTLAEKYWPLWDRRIRDIAEYYSDRIDAWDIVNESAQDLWKGFSMNRGGKLMKSHYGIMPADYAFKGFKTADEAFPKSVKLIINDWENGQTYADQVKSLLARGCRIDVLGSQMHLFNPKQCADIAAGADIETPKKEWERFALLAQPGLPIHLSEITITAPNDDAHGRLVQAVITYNLYRLWFSIEKMAGITWWNVVDNCGAKGEPSTSGLFTRDMQPKPSFFALDRLINHEWRTNIDAKVGKDGKLRFRGFRGRYVVTWKDGAGAEHSMEYTAK